MQRPPSETNPAVQFTSRGFPSQLFALLEQVEEDGIAHIVSWRPHGRAFRVHRREHFTEIVLPRWFRHSNFSSFQRQLSIYGFQRIPEGRDKNSYYHENFVRGHYEWTFGIERIAVKGIRARKPNDPTAHPNFYDEVSGDGNVPSNINRTARTISNPPHRETSNQTPIHVAPLMTQTGIVPSSYDQHSRDELLSKLVLQLTPFQRNPFPAVFASVHSNDAYQRLSFPATFQATATINSSNLTQAVLPTFDQSTLEALFSQLRRSASHSDRTRQLLQQNQSTESTLLLPLQQSTFYGASNVESIRPDLLPLDQSTANALLRRLQQSALYGASNVQSQRTDLLPWNQSTLEAFLSQQLNSPRPSYSEEVMQSQALLDFLQHRNPRIRTSEEESLIQNNPYHNNLSPGVNPEILEFIRGHLNHNGRRL